MHKDTGMHERFSPRQIGRKVDGINRLILEKTHLEGILTHPASLSVSGLLMVWRGIPTYHGVVEKDVLQVVTNSGIIIASGFGINTRLRIFFQRNPELIGKIRQRVNNIVRHNSSISL